LHINGGEPTVHKDFVAFSHDARAAALGRVMVLGTNAITIAATSDSWTRFWPVGSGPTTIPGPAELVVATALSLRRHHADTLIVPMSRSGQ